MKVASMIGVGSTLFLLSCAGTETPKRLSETEAAVGAATQVGTQGEPQAALYLNLAKEELAKAKELAAEGEAELADQMLLRSQSDAELAVSLSRQSKERLEAERALQNVRSLRAKINQPGVIR